MNIGIYDGRWDPSARRELRVLAAALAISLVIHAAAIALLPGMRNDAQSLLTRTLEVVLIKAPEPLPMRETPKPLPMQETRPEPKPRVEPATKPREERIPRGLAQEARLGRQCQSPCRTNAAQ